MRKRKRWNNLKRKSKLNFNKKRKWNWVKQQRAAATKYTEHRKNWIKKQHRHERTNERNQKKHAEDLFVCWLGFLVTQYFGFVYRHTIPRNFRLNISWKSHHNKALKCVPFFSLAFCAFFTLTYNLHPSHPSRSRSRFLGIRIIYYKTNSLCYTTNDSCVRACVCVCVCASFSHLLTFSFFILLLRFNII